MHVPFTNYILDLVSQRSGIGSRKHVRTF